MPGKSKYAVDGLLGACGFAFAAPSLSWPFGWDTSVHYYVGREWLLHGALPYRDSFDHKPPAIHWVHALTIALFGPTMWGFRLVELVCVVTLGCASASLATGRQSRAPQGLYGASVLAASVLYYGFFDYWNTAQCELLGATLATLMVLAAVRFRRPVLAAVVSGLLAGAELSLKPPFALFALVPVVLLALRASRAGPRGAAARVAQAMAIFALASVAAPGAFLAYFAGHGALGALEEVLFGLNVQYVVHEPRIRSVGGMLAVAGTMWRFFCPVASSLVGASAVGVVLAWRRGSSDRLRRWALAGAMNALALLTVVVQLKFFLYHWIAALPGVTLLFANATVELSLSLRRRSRAWATVGASAAAALVFAGTGCQYEDWVRTTGATVRYWLGRSSRAEYASTFETWDGLRKYGDLEAAGLWVRDHSSAQDYVLVRGLAAEVYVVSGRRAPERFFWTAFLVDWRPYHHGAWLAEDASAIRRTRPRYVVTDGPAPSGIESEAWFLSMGYLERARFGRLSILERGEGGQGEERRQSRAPRSP